MTDFLSLPPFNLSAEDLAWVRRIRDSLGTEERLRQLFVLQQFQDDPAQARQTMASRPGGVHRAWGQDLAQAWQTTRTVLEAAEIPPLITGDLEGGGYGNGGATPLPNLMGTAAMDDLDLSRQVVEVLAREAQAMGFDWSFTPVIDINQRGDSAIVGTRSYGADLATIERQALVHVQAMQAAGLAATAKHWPGEGFDARDQHLVTTVNPLSWDAWQDQHGRLYRKLIGAGVMAVMAGHIAWPAGAQHLRPQVGRSAWQPASISHELNTVLLRQRLGFNGVLTSDATGMAGFGSWATRAEMVPAVIASGCDVFLFSRDMEADLALMLRGLREGRLTEARIDEAVTRVLGLKAALGLHRRRIDEGLPPLEALRELLATPAHRDVGQRAAAAGITLVKNQGVLPLDAQRHRRVVVISPGIETVWPGAAGGDLNTLQDGLRARGFELRSFDPANPPTRENCDLVLYLLAKESMLTHSRIYLDWRQLHGTLFESMRRYWHEVPTLMVSFGHAGYLIDAPRVPAYINAYSAIAPVQQALLRKLLGEEAFTGLSPIDPFCGQAEAQW